MFQGIKSAHHSRQLQIRPLVSSADLSLGKLGIRSMNPSRKLLLCLSTVASAEDAERIAAALIAQSLAACVQIEGPIRSHYRWQGQIQCDQEYRLVIKSAVTVWEQLKSTLIDLHPYDEPQIVMIEIDDASDGYRDWVLAQTEHVTS